MSDGRPVVAVLLSDPPGHVREALNDDETVGRALYVQQLTGQPVTLVTYDRTGMTLRARSRGLHAADFAPGE